jgi:2-phospho-L-lactate guanylyltransferase
MCPDFRHRPQSGHDTEDREILMTSQSIDTLKVYVAIPCRSFGDGKSRLRTVLSDRDCDVLVRSMLVRTIRAARQAVRPDWVRVVTGDPAVACLARALGCQVLRPEQDGSLIDAAEAALAAARAECADALAILPIDLPALRPADLAEAIRSLREVPGVSLQPAARDGGTNFLLCAPPGIIPFRFGANSFDKHVAETLSADIRPTILNIAGMAFDLDTPQDLEAWRKKAQDQQLALRGEFAE